MGISSQITFLEKIWARKGGCRISSSGGSWRSASIGMSGLSAVWQIGVARRWWGGKTWGEQAKIGEGGPSRGDLVVKGVGERIWKGGNVGGPWREERGLWSGRSRVQIWGVLWGLRKPGELRACWEGDGRNVVGMLVSQRIWGQQLQQRRLGVVVWG